MKIICIGRNYYNHIKELNNAIPQKPVFFLKPDSSILVNNKPFFYPPFTKNLHYEVEVIARIGKVGKCIHSKFAHRYIAEIGLGIDFTARDLQDECKEKGLPWEMAKSFDNSAALSSWYPISEYPDLQNIHFSLEINGVIVQQSNTKNMIFPFSEIISYVSQFMTIKIGDVIFSGTPEGVGPVQINDHLIGYLNGKKVLDFYIK